MTDITGPHFDVSAVTKVYLVRVDATGDGTMRAAWVLELLHWSVAMLLLGRSAVVSASFYPGSNTLRGRLKWTWRLLCGAARLALSGKCAVPGDVPKV